MAKTLDPTEAALAEIGVIEPDAIPTQAINPDEELINLPSGRVAIVRQGTMADLEAAQVESGGKQSKVLSFLITRLVTIDGNPLTYEQYRALSLKDGTLIVNTVSKQFPEGES